MIKIAFVGFWPEFNIYDNFITLLLGEFVKYEVINVQIDVERRKEVEYLFYSSFTYEFLEYNCIRIFYTGENTFPDFNLCDYAIGFEDFQLGDRYVRYPLAYANYRDVVRYIENGDRKVTYNKKLFCAMVVSNGSLADPKRDELFDLLSIYKRVDSGGKYRNNIDYPNGVPDKIEFMQKYKFGLAIENVSHPGYCTEKIYDCFAAGVIPIYWGDPMVEEYFNREAFINAMRYNTTQELMDAIVDLDTNGEKYTEMLSHNPIKDDYRLEIMDNKLRQFLTNIFKQEYSQAFRRSQYGWSQNYEKILRISFLNSKKWEEYEDKKNRRVCRRILRKLINRKKWLETND